MEKSKYIFGISCVISILLLLLSVLVCVGLTILILSLVNNDKPYKQSINLISNQTLQLELKNRRLFEKLQLGYETNFSSTHPLYIKPNSIKVWCLFTREK